MFAIFKKQVFVLLFFSIVTIVLWAILISGNLREGKLTVAFLDIGQGDSIFIESPTGRQILIDGGRDRLVLRQLSKLMPFYDRSINMLVATHPDADHIGGLLSVLKRFDVGVILRPGVKNDTPATESLLKSIAGGATKEILARRGQVYDIGGGAYIRVLLPDRDVSGLDPNDASIVVQVVYGEHKFLLTGDSPKNMEKYLLSLHGDSLKSDVLKLGHHGSKTSSSDLFLAFVAPQYAIISAGKNNRYGHPHREVLEKLERFDIPYFNTAKVGTIVFTTDGKNLKMVKATP